MPRRSETRRLCTLPLEAGQTSRMTTEQRLAKAGVVQMPVPVPMSRIR